MLKRLEFAHGQLHFDADYVRGRCMKTTVDVSRGGTVVLDTVNRDQAATRWVHRLKGKKLDPRHRLRGLFLLFGLFERATSPRTRHKRRAPSGSLFRSLGMLLRPSGQ